MTTNISECVKAILKGTRNLPVTSLVKSTYERFAELFVIRGQMAKAQFGTGHQFCQVLEKAIKHHLRDLRCFTVTLFDRHQSEYTMAETTLTDNFLLSAYRVSPRDHTYDCGYFQALNYPCFHAITCCAQLRLNRATYVGDVYSMTKVFNVYRMRFALPIPEGLWPPYDGPTIIPDPNMRSIREGQPRSTRIRNTMEEADPSRPKHYGLCRQPGHTRRKCPQRGSMTRGEA
nr:uncharacterized protein LOC114924521 [Arachis hypogaea]